MAKDDRDERPARYTEGDLVVYRASGVGGCPRTFVLRHQRHKPAPHPEWFQQVLDEGTENESMIDHLWEVRTGVQSIDHQREYDLEVLPGVVIRCHIDGAAGTHAAIREYKKVRAGKDGKAWEEFKRRGPEMHTHWLWQVATIMHATGRELEFVGGKFTVDDDGNGAVREVHPHHLIDPPLPLKALRLKVAKIERLMDQPVKAEDVECTSQYPCPFYNSGKCGAQAKRDAKDAKTLTATDWTKDEDAEVLRVLVAKFTEAATESTRLNAEVKRAGADKKAALEGVQGWLAAKGVPEADSFTIDGRTFTITTTDDAEVAAFTRKGYTQMSEIKKKKGKGE
jgi:hypothetical protein